MLQFDHRTIVKDSQSGVKRSFHLLPPIVTVLVLAQTLASKHPFRYIPRVEREQELITRCLQGDAAAWDMLFDRYYSVAGRFILQLSPTLSLEDVDEICQEVFIAVIRNLSTFKGNSSFTTWLFRIATNKTRDLVDKQKTAKRGGGTVPLSLDAEDPRTGLKLDPPANSAAPDDAMMTAERMILLRDALDQLGDPCREIIELKYFGDLSYDEIALELELNPKTVSSRLSKCLDKLEELARPLFQREDILQSPV